MELVYKTMLLMVYYGLFRVGEIAAGNHTIKAKDVLVRQNKNKILIVLYSSKTHGKESHPQTVKISTIEKYQSKTCFFCPFTAMRIYGKARGPFIFDQEQFFVFSDHLPVQPTHIRTVLKTLLERLNLNPELI